MQNHKLAGRAQSVKKSTVRMVENHLAKQRNAYDAWIQELCSDAEESAAERDRLKAKLMKLREEHKRKMARSPRMIKILSRMSNMVYYRAWSCWYNATIRIHQMSIDEEIKMLRAEVKDARAQAERKLILKIMTKMVQGLARVAYTQWYKQTFMAKHQKNLMLKIIKRLERGQLAKGWTQWKVIATKWALIEKMELKERLIKELDMLEKKAKEFEQEASSRSEQATMAAINRCSSEQKDLLIKIMAKMCDNFLVMGWSMWKKKMNIYNNTVKLVGKILSRMVNMKKHQAFRRWHEVCFELVADKFKLKEELLISQRDNLMNTLKARALQLEKLQAEAAELLELSQRNAADTANVMAVSNRFADNIHVILDKKALEEVDGPDPNKVSYDDFVKELGD
ncbi:mannosyl-oligosaccharide 1,2-alpha-mannosidase [Aureococcus anophagefferens]|nr:mannosyl-oligosaccharide 1,2-alpha-mannosidase [Aureococcus anophagefferens]